MIACSYTRASHTQLLIACTDLHTSMFEARHPIKYQRAPTSLFRHASREAECNPLPHIVTRLAYNCHTTLPTPLHIRYANTYHRPYPISKHVSPGNPM